MIHSYDHDDDDCDHDHDVEANYVDDNDDYDDDYDDDEEWCRAASAVAQPLTLLLPQQLLIINPSR